MKKVLKELWFDTPAAIPAAIYVEKIRAQKSELETATKSFGRGPDETVWDIEGYRYRVIWFELETGRAAE